MRQIIGGIIPGMELIDYDCPCSSALIATPAAEHLLSEAVVVNMVII